MVTARKLIMPLSYIPWSTDDSPLSSLSLYLDEIGGLPQLTHEQACSLALRVKQGDKRAKRQMILANLKLVVFVAKRYGDRNMDLSDHIQSGYFGLDKAVERFDPTRNIHFSTYACYWIRQSITREQANTARPVRLPVHVYEKLAALDKATDAWFLSHGTEPEADDLAASLGVPVSSILHLQSLREHALSLDYSYSDNDDDDERSFLSFLPDTGSSACLDEVDEQDEHDQMRTQVHAALAHLTSRERTVVTLLFGLDGAGKRTLAEVGRMTGVSRERVRQIQAVAFEKLRQEPALEALLERRAS